MEVFSKAVQRASNERSALSGNTIEGELIVRNQGTSLQRIEYTDTPIKTVRDYIFAADEEDEHGKLTATAHAYDILRAQVLQQLHQYNWNMLAITSPTKGNGKTTTAVNLAISIARSASHSVLLVDLDLRSPALHHYFGIQPTLGVADLIKGQTDFSDVAFNPGIPGLVVLPGIGKQGRASDLLTTPRMEAFVEEIQHRYAKRIIIFDMPPTLGGADVLSFIPMVQTSLLVAEAGRTTKSELHGAMKVLERSRILGTVLNRGTIHNKDT